MPPASGSNALPVNFELLLGDVSLIQDVGGSASTERQEEARNSWEKHCGLHSTQLMLSAPVVQANSKKLWQRAERF